MRNGLVTKEALASDLADDIADKFERAINPVLVSASGSSRVAQAASAAASRAVSEAQAAAARARLTLDDVEAERRLTIAAFARLKRNVDEKMREVVDLQDVNPPPTPLLGYGAGGFYGADRDGASATAADYAQVAIEWAEHLPDTIPPNVLAVNAITGEHWSSRWWAHKSANAFGMQAWWYQGAWPSPGPPSTPFTPIGDPIPAGAMYFDTDRQQMMVWTGDAWAPIGAPAPAATMSLYYAASASQTIFPTTSADMFGHSYALKADGSNGVETSLNGVRLVPDDGSGVGDFRVDPVASRVTLLKGAMAGAVLTVDVLASPASLAPGAVLIKRITPIVPDGSMTTFTLACADASPINIQSPAELFVSLDGVPQEPVVAYGVTSNSIVFVEAPRADAYVYILWSGSSGVGGGGGGGGAAPSDALPRMDGVAAAGIDAAYARGDHVHPGDSSKLSDAPSDGALYARLNGAWASGGALNGSLTVNGGFYLCRSAFVAATVPASGAVTLSWPAGEVQKLSLNANSTIDVTGWPPSGNWARVVLDITNAGAFAVTGWPANVRWAGGAAPTITSGAGKRDVVVLMTMDAGATILGSVAGQDYR